MSINFMVKEAIRGFGRSRRLNLISLGAMSVSLMALGLVFVLNLGIWRIADYIEGKVEIVAFLSEQLSNEQVDRFLTKLHDHPQVVQVTYISKADAAKQFEQDPALKRLMVALGSNPLPASVRVSLMEKSPENIKTFVQWLDQLSGVEEASYGGGDAERLLKAMQFVRMTVLILSVALATSAIIIIANIISLMVYSRQQEISIMLMIGATHGFIRGPFLIWGIFQGIFGGIIANGFLYGIWQVLAFYALHDFGIQLNAMLSPYILKLTIAGVVGLILTGAMLGLAGSLVSVGKQLND